MTVLLCGCSINETEVIVRIPITLENWDEYFELKSTIEVINEERRIREATIHYKIALKEQYLDKVVTEKDSEIKYQIEICGGQRIITFIEGKNEIEFGKIIHKDYPEIRDGSIWSIMGDGENQVYVGEEWSYETKTASQKSNLNTIEEFEMLEIEGDLYLYGK